MKDYSKIHPWELYSKELLTDYKQSIEEGLDIEAYKDLIFAVANMPHDDNKEKMADIIFNIVSSAKTVEGYKYVEPSDLEGIRKLRQKHPIKKRRLGKRELENRA